MKFDVLVLQTFGRLEGVRMFLDHLDDTLPRLEWSENEELKRRAEQESWEYADFDVERQILDERFRFWLPRFTAYSVVALLYTVLETQLVAAAERVAFEKKVAFQLSDVRGNGVDAACLYLKRLGQYDVRRDPSWESISSLRELRNLVVHRAGTRGQTEAHKKTAQRLARMHKGRIVFPESDWSWYGEVWVSLSLCREYIEVVESFFDRLFDSLGLPPRYQRRLESGAR